MKNELCTQKTTYGEQRGGYARSTYPTCVYYDRLKQRCTLRYCYRAVKEKKGAKA